MINEGNHWILVTLRPLRKDIFKRNRTPIGGSNEPAEVSKRRHGQQLANVSFSINS